MSNERIIIGESAQAGHPISAPVIDPSRNTRTSIRWRRRPDGSFALEQWVGNRLAPVHTEDGKDSWWEEVPCITL